MGVRKILLRAAAVAYSLYGQVNPAWGGALLGFGPDTIAGAGCYLTTDAMIMTWMAQGASGVPMGSIINPLQLNDLYKANGIYVSGDLLPDTALHLAFPNLIELVDTYTPSGAADLSKCDNTASTDYVLVFVRFPHGLAGDNPHFLPVWNYKAGGASSTLMVADSYDGVIKPLSHYGDPATIIMKVLRLRIITQPPASTKFAKGDRVQVNAGPLNVRVTPATTGGLAGTQTVGAQGIVVGGPVNATTHNWWNVTFDAGVSGWSAEDFLDKATAPKPPPQPSPLPVAPLRAMYDSTNLADIPASAPIILRYVDGAYVATLADAQAKFPNAIHQGISAIGTDAGEWIDCEAGDATPDFTPGWVVMRRAKLVNAGVYMNEATWPVVRAAFQAAGIPEPPYIVARWAAGAPPSIPDGAIALQYANPDFTLAHYDLSEVAVDFPPAPLKPPQPPALTYTVSASDGYASPTVFTDLAVAKANADAYAAAHFGITVTVMDSNRAVVYTTNIAPYPPVNPPQDIWPWLQAIFNWIRARFGG